MPAEDSLARLAFLLAGDQDRADALVRDTLRRGGATAELTREWLAGPAGGYEPDPEPESTDRELLRRGLGMLAPRQRAAVVLRHWAGLPVPGTAAVLGCPEPAVDHDTTAALDVLATTPERLAEGLAAVAADARPAPVDLAEPVAAGARHWRLAGTAAGLLVAAGVFAAVLGLGSAPPDPPRAAPRTPPTDSPTVVPSAVPVAGDPAGRFDRRSRRLTAQLAGARPDVLPGRGDLQPAVVTTSTGTVLWAPLVFHLGDVPDTYRAMATLGGGRDAAVLAIEVGYRDPHADPRYLPCPAFELDCTDRGFPDGTYGGVTVLTEPETDQTINRLTVMRPDGTFCHVAVFYRERRPDPPPLGVDDLFRFATVFSY